MMSSEGSVSSGGSRIRQFGLYRSIDARTEEFLRLSRRRQIRQGCACAAVSTAITVIVVVVVIFVYEFSLNSEVNIESSLKRNWFSLINDTTENGFKTKYTKAGIDKTTLTILPILLKALKKNVFLEKILEEQSSSSPIYDTKQTTERSFDRNMFTKNWFRVPSKLYAISYKTSPIAYYRSPLQNMEYFTKIRKIRDYQRIINYVDKMISERVYIGSTKPMVNQELLTEKPVIRAVPKAKLKYKSMTPKSTTQIPKSGDVKMEDKIISCKCPTKLGEILNKKLSGIEKLLSTDASKELKTNTDCHDKNKMKQPNEILVPKLSYFETNKNNQTQIIIDKKINDDVDKNSQLETSNEEDKVKSAQEFWQQESQYVNYYTNHESTTFVPIDHFDVTDEVPQLLTKPMSSVNKYKKALEPNSIVNFIKINNKIINEKKPYIKLNNEIIHEEQKAITTSRNDLKNLETIFLKNDEDNYVEKLHPDIFEFKLVLKDKNIQIRPKPTEHSIPLFKTRSTTIQSTSHITEPIVMFTKFNTINSRDKITKDVSSTVDDETKNPRSTTIKSTSHEAKSETKNSQDKITTNVLSTVDEETENLNNLTQVDLLWEELKNENVPAWKSMTPNHRPIYLEIHQKNEWKHDDQDYDFNLINNYDNIPDIA